MYERLPWISEDAEQKTQLSLHIQSVFLPEENDFCGANPQKFLILSRIKTRFPSLPCSNVWPHVSVLAMGYE